MKIAFIVSSVMLLMPSASAKYSIDTCLTKVTPGQGNKPPTHWCWVCHGTSSHEVNPYTSNCVDYNSVIKNRGHADTSWHNSHPEHNKYNDMIWCPNVIPDADKSDYKAIYYVDPNMDPVDWPTFTHGFVNGLPLQDGDPYPENTVWDVYQCRVGDIEGDPHVKGWDGEWYDYHGECDLVFLTAPSFGGGLGLDIHVRTRIRQYYSYIESAAIRIGNDVFEVDSYGDYFLNGVSGAELPRTIAGYPVSHEKLSEKLDKFYIHLSDSETIMFKAFKDLVAVNIISPTFEHFGDSIGLLGDFHKGQRVARDGHTVIEDMNDFGQEWQVLVSEPHLFQSAREPQHPQQCRLPEPEAQTQRRLGQSIAEETARKACAHWGDEIEQCVFDVMATGDLEYAVVAAL